MSDRLSVPQGTADDIILRRGTTIGRMRDNHPAVGQPTQDTIDGPGSSDTD